MTKAKRFLEAIIPLDAKISKDIDKLIPPLYKWADYNQKYFSQLSGTDLTNGFEMFLRQNMPNFSDFRLDYKLVKATGSAGDKAIAIGGEAGNDPLKRKPYLVKVSLNTAYDYNRLVGNIREIKYQVDRLKSVVIHEITHVRQYYRAASGGVIPRSSSLLTRTAKEMRTSKTTKGISPAKSLERTGTTPKGKYFGVPEELMAYAQQAVQAIKDQRPESAFKIYKLVVSNITKDGPAHKRFKKYFVDYMLDAGISPALTKFRLAEFEKKAQSWWS